jgi:16S rRNA (cytidine1402-2'-O)-methyltransferase
MGILYVVSTPIGNLEDITLRALRILKEADVILAEDTRVTRKLLDYYDIKGNILSYHQHSNEARKFEILKLLLEGKKIALVSDAGTPGISDPGNELIDFLYQSYPNNPPFKLEVVPGASSLTAALSISGFRTNNFVFLGFMPKKGKEKILNKMKDLGFTFAFFESPNRVLKSLELLKDFFGGQKRVAVFRELTKVYETSYRGDLEAVINKLSNSKIKGEVVVVLEGE